MHKKIVGILLLTTLTSIAAYPNGSKITAVQDTLNLSCKMKVSDEEALHYIKRLYLSCIPNTEVEITETCSVVCLRPSTGVVIGR